MISAAMITKRNIEMFHLESRKCIHLGGVKSQRSRSRGKNQWRHGCLHSYECQFLLVVFLIFVVFYVYLYIKWSRWSSHSAVCVSLCVRAITSEIVASDLDIWPADSSCHYLGQNTRSRSQVDVQGHGRKMLLEVGSTLSESFSGVLVFLPHRLYTL